MYCRNNKLLAVVQAIFLTKMPTDLWPFGGIYMTTKKAERHRAVYKNVLSIDAFWSKWIPLHKLFLTAQVVNLQFPVHVDWRAQNSSFQIDVHRTQVCVIGKRECSYYRFLSCLFWGQKLNEAWTDVTVSEYFDHNYFSFICYWLYTQKNTRQ